MKVPKKGKRFPVRKYSTVIKQTYIIMYGTEQTPKEEIFEASSLKSVWNRLNGLSSSNEMEPKYIVLPDSRRVKFDFSLFQHCYENGRITEEQLLLLCSPEKQQFLKEAAIKMSIAFDRFL